MSSSVPTKFNISEPLIEISHSLDAMQLAQLSAFAYSIPQLYLCREYLSVDEQVAIDECLQRLQKGLSENVFTIETLRCLLAEKEFFDSAEARLRLAPELALDIED